MVTMYYKNGMIFKEMVFGCLAPQIPIISTKPQTFQFSIKQQKPPLLQQESKRNQKIFVTHKF